MLVVVEEASSLDKINFHSYVEIDNERNER